MTPNEPSSQVPLSDKIENAGNIGLTICEAWAAPILACTRSDFGHRYFGLLAAAGLAVFWFVLAANEPPSPLGLANLLGIFVCFRMVLHKQRARRQRMRPDARHSYYAGFPWVARLLRSSEHTAKRFWEPLMVLLVGLSLRQAAPALGCYLMGGSIAMLVLYLVGLEYRQRMVERYRNAQLEQQQLADELDQFE
jgi:hypothetical protein